MNNCLYSSASCEWETPQYLFDMLNEEFHFTLDPCSTDENAKCEKHYTKEQDGLKQDWTGETVFCNPPYGKEIRDWIRKCYEHSIGGVLRYFLYRPEQIRDGFINTYITRLKYDLLKSE